MVRIGCIYTILFGLVMSTTAALADAGPDGGDTDTGDTESDTPFCETVSDPCCLDNGSDADIFELSGCNGEPYGTAAEGVLGGECTYDPENPAGLGNCVGITQCWNFRKWWDATSPAEGGECGLCLELCVNFGSCPDGENDLYSYDFCTSSCPEGMRCWVYLYEDNKRGLCMADCETDEDCSSGICATEWNVCVPRPEFCPLPEDTDSDTETSTWPEDDAGEWDAGVNDGPDEGGCVCSPTPPRTATSLIDLLVDALIR